MAMYYATILEVLSYRLAQAMLDAGIGADDRV